MNDKPQFFITWATVLIIISAITGGIYMIGGPSHARSTKNDQARLSALVDTSKVIACYMDKHGALPDQLANMMKDFNSGDLEINKYCKRLKYKDDPISHAPFEYNKLSDNTFELCADFELPTQSIRSSYNRNSVFVNISHHREASGRHCYLAKNWVERRS